MGNAAVTDVLRIGQSGAQVDGNFAVLWLVPTRTHCVSNREAHKAMGAVGEGEVGGNMEESSSGQKTPFSMLSQPNVGRYQRRRYWLWRESGQETINVKQKSDQYCPSARTPGTAQRDALTFNFF